MPEDKADLPPAQEINPVTYQRVKSSVEQGNYTTLVCQPGEAKAAVDRLSSELAGTYRAMRVTIPEVGKDYRSVVSDFSSLAPDTAIGEIKDGQSTGQNFAYLLEKTSEVNDKPVLAIIENLQYVTQGRDDLIRAVRALYNARALNSSLKKLTFLLIADQHPTSLLKDMMGTPYNIGTNIYVNFPSE